MRDILLSGTAGFLSSCAAAFAVHRALWKGADEHARHLDSIAHTETERLLHTPKHDQVRPIHNFSLLSFRTDFSARVCCSLFSGANLF